MAIYTVPTANAVQKTLDAQLLTGATASVTLNNVTSIPDAAGVFVVDRVDSNGNATASKREYISFTGVSGSTLTGLTRGLAGSSDQDHEVGAIVEFVNDVTQQKAIKDTFETEHNADGTHDSATVTTLKATGAEVNTGTEDAKIVTPKAIADSSYLPAIDEDDMASDSDTQVPTQQSVKAYVDDNAGGAWTAYSAVTPTRASADDPTYVLTFAGVDLTDTISIGMRIKLTQDGTVRYFIVTAIAFSTNTTLTLYGGTDYDVEDTATYTISDFNYSSDKAPFGFPLSPSKWSVRVTDGTVRSQSSPSSSTWYNVGTTNSQINIPIGVWNVKYQVRLAFDGATSNSRSMRVTLSTANNSASDSELTAGVYGTYTSSVVSSHASFLSRSKILTLTTKDTYYLNGYLGFSGAGNMYFNNEDHDMVIEAVCAYL